MIVAVVNADDFGLSVSINEGIWDAYEHGIVRSASLMANGEGFDDAVARVKEFPGLGVGVHLSLVGERPIAPAHELHALVTSDGRLPTSYSQFARGYLLGNSRCAKCAGKLRRKLSRSEGRRPAHPPGQPSTYPFAAGCFRSHAGPSQSLSHRRRPRSLRSGSYFPGARFGAWSQASGRLSS